MENRNGYQQKKPTVYPDGTVQRPRTARPRPSAVPPSSNVINMGQQSTRPAPNGRQTQRTNANVSAQTPRVPVGGTPMRGQPQNRQRPASAAPARGQRPAPQGRGANQGRQPKAPQIRQKNGDWVIPEGSAIYTSQGRMYEPRRGNVQQGAAGQRRPQPPRNGAPRHKAPAPPKKKKKKRNIGATFLFWTRAFMIRLLIFFVAVVLSGLWWYRAEFYSNVGESGNKITYTVDNGSGLSVTADSSSAWYGGVMYVDFSMLYPQFNMAAVGSLDSMRFIIKLDGIRDSSGGGNEQYVIFTDGSRTANINGSAVVMQSRCRVIGEDIWVPLSFIENYMDGVDVDRVSENSVVFTSPDKLEAEKANKESKKPKKLNAAYFPIIPDFRLKRSDVLSSAAYPE